MTNEEAKVFLDNLKTCIEEHPIVADWLVEIADRKTEPSGYKMTPLDKDINVRSKEPQTCDTCKYADKEWYEEPCDRCGYMGRYEPKTEPQRGCDADCNEDCNECAKETELWRAEQTEPSGYNLLPLDKDINVRSKEPQIYKPTCNGECRNCEYRAKDGNYCMKMDEPQTLDDIGRQIQDAYDKGLLSDADAVQAWYEAVKDEPQTERSK